MRTNIDPVFRCKVCGCREDKDFVLTSLFPFNGEIVCGYCRDWAQRYKSYYYRFKREGY